MPLLFLSEKGGWEKSIVIILRRRDYNSIYPLKVALEGLRQ